MAVEPDGAGVRNVNLYGAVPDDGALERLLGRCLSAVMLQTLEAYDGVAEAPGVPTKADMKTKRDLVCLVDDEGQVRVADRSDSPGMVRGGARRGGLPRKVKVRSLFERPFAAVRAECGTVVDELRSSLEQPAGTVWTHTHTPAKGGSKMMFGANVMAKTMGEVERDALKRMLPEYYTHLQAHPGTLLPRFLFAITLSCTSAGQIISDTYCVMHNVICSPRPVLEVYDLKGSNHGRTAGHELPAPFIDSPVLIRLDNDVRGARLVRHRDTDTLLAQLERDSAWLRDHSIIDYSLLVGRRPADGEAGCAGVLDTGVEGDDALVYYVGIIDVLQPYTGLRRFETALKGFVTANEDGISVIPPDRYHARFLASHAPLLGPVPEAASDDAPGPAPPPEPSPAQ
eukprot:TRINITY_DN30387_c0_g1_i1.p1 TRINITY_DN30387_c0_g1~~TRINITY_DN30387_c0_g1_i1.p1  ORF type:complete len:416 (+),score=124.38 TRINITY_DN30387_c0_g1_i1:53-1249(+)